MVQHSQQHVAPCVKVVEWRLGTRGLRMVAMLWAGIPVEVIQEAGVVPQCYQDTLFVASYDMEGNGGHILPPIHMQIDDNIMKIILV